MTTVKAGPLQLLSSGHLLKGPQWKPCNIVVTTMGELLVFEPNDVRVKTIVDFSMCGMDALEIMPAAVAKLETEPLWRVAVTTPSLGRFILGMRSEAQMNRWVVAIMRVLTANIRPATPPLKAKSTEVAVPSIIASKKVGSRRLKSPHDPTTSSDDDDDDSNNTRFLAMYRSKHKAVWA
ncbi:Aste57867_12868 [Aphanomyces stellatus]|uniref:Aste57867_12868 protein n=1 Tax=Aphanomyces stellatus TaxID=120398 RepID=A0A485KXD6_9STRA|nr:hypothetical protein As57867_012820 [Aphanomyces stellatus]VFT89715.1 Aste57867_12868 [Aphanomyces stellatus]